MCHFGASGLALGCRVRRVFWGFSGVDEKLVTREEVTISEFQLSDVLTGVINTGGGGVDVRCR